MTPRTRAIAGSIALAVLGGVMVVAVFGLEPFGHYPGPYGDLVARIVPDQRQATALVSAITFDVRGFDTLGEEFILFAAVCGAAALLRARRRERGDDAPRPSRPEPSFAARTVGGALVAPVLVLFAYVTLHGHISPGGGFQGGVVGAGALLLAYAAGQTVRLKRGGTMAALEVTEAVGGAAFLALAIGTLVAAGAMLQNDLPLGTAGMLLSAGTIPIGNIAVGVEVAGGVALVLAEFLEHALLEDPE
ncbi:MAG: MnhB domain-containing protein [Solirubrobacteraceae bacterium]